MRAKFIYESIKHLKPRSEEELMHSPIKQRLAFGITNNLYRLVKSAIDDGVDLNVKHNFKWEGNFYPLHFATMCYYDLKTAAERINMVKIVNLLRDNTTNKDAIESYNNYDIENQMLDFFSKRY